MDISLDFSNQIPALFDTVDRQNVKLLSWSQREKCKQALQKSNDTTHRRLDEKTFLEIKAVLEMKKEETRELQNAVIRIALYVYGLICSAFKGLFNMIGGRISSQELLDLAKAYQPITSSPSKVVEDETIHSIEELKLDSNTDWSNMLDELKGFDVTSMHPLVSEEALEEPCPIDSEKLDGDNIGISHTIGRRSAMEDSSIYRKLDLYDLELFGVFDGHTDKNKQEIHHCSKFVKDRVEGILLDSLKQHNPHALTEEGITAAFKECCENLDNEYHKENNDDGTTLLLVLRQSNKLSIANLGDSRAIVIVEEDGIFEAECQTVDATPEKFKDEIERKGGKVFGKKIGGMLSVAASIGDHNCKATEDGEKLTTNIPEVSFYTLEPSKNYYLLLACDGLFETGKDILETIQENIHEPADVISRRLVNEAIKDGSGDNITALFAILQEG